MSDDAFRDLHGRFARRLMAVVLRRLWEKDRLAEDVVQSVLLSYAVNHQGKAAGSTQTELWQILLGVALRHCDKHNKRTSRRKRAGTSEVPFSTLEDQVDEDNFDPKDPSPDPEERVFKVCVDDFLVLLEKKGLDERERGVLRLMLAGYTLEEMRAGTGLPMGRVRDIVSRIRGVAQQWAEEEE